jgi:hypothetical protein
VHLDCTNGAPGRVRRCVAVGEQLRVFVEERRGGAIRTLSSSSSMLTPAAGKTRQS